MIAHHIDAKGITQVHGLDEYAILRGIGEGRLTPLHGNILVPTTLFHIDEVAAWAAERRERKAKRAARLSAVPANLSELLEEHAAMLRTGTATATLDAHWRLILEAHGAALKA